MSNAQFELAIIDYVIVLAYFIGILAHGLYVSRGNRESGASGYFLAGRSLPWYLIGFSLFASNMSGSSFVGLMGGSYANGVVIFNYEWMAAFILTLFAIFVLPSYLRAKVSTVPEFLKLRYDARSQRTFSVFTILAIMFIDTAGALYAGGLVIANIFLMMLPGLIALKLYPELDTPDLTFPSLAFDLMPIGLLGLIMAALIAASTLVTLDFVKPLRPDLSDGQLVVIGRVTTGICMVIGAIYAPSIAGFESLFGYFQSSLSYVVPPIVVVYILGLFVPWLNGHGAFWTMAAGLILGVPLFILKEVTGVWGAIGLPPIQYTIMSSIIMFVAIAMHLSISAATRRPSDEAIGTLVWSGGETTEIFTNLERPVYADRTLWCALLMVCMTGMIVWFW